VDDLDAMRPASNFFGADTREALREHAPIGGLELDGIAGDERAVAAHDADGKQAAAVHDQRALRSLVDGEPSHRRLGVAEPQLERSAAVDIVGSEARASPFPGDDRAEHLAGPAGGDHRRDAGSSGEPRGCDLARHATAAERASSTESRGLGGGAVDEQLRIRGSGMRGIDPVHLGQEDEQPRACQDRDLCGQRVVVAECDLVRRSRVVLVHDGNDTELQQRVECIAHIDVARTFREIGRREQDLRSLDPRGAQRGVPAGLEPRLPHCRRGLQPRSRRGPTRQPESREAERDRTGRDDAHRLAAAHEVTDLGGACAEQRAPDAALVVDDERRAELDDDRHRCWLPSPTMRYCRR